MRHLNIDGIDLIALLTINDLKYGNIKICKTLDFIDEIFVINNKIIKDSSIISEIKKEHGLELPEMYKNIVF